MTPAEGELPNGARVAVPPAESRPGGAEELRRKHIRRRVVAAGALVLLIAWLGGLASSGGPVKHGLASARGAHRATVAQLAAEQAAERRQQKALESTLASVPLVTAGGGVAREVALTFDDGPGPFTPQILDVLERMHVPATFFIVGTSLRDFGSYLPRELADGFVIGDHTQHHPAMASLSPRDQVAEMSDQAMAVRALGAPTPRLFRPPYGSFNRVTLTEARRLDMVTVLWSVDTKDFQQPGAGAIVHTLLAEVKPGAIVLMHDAGGPRRETVAALPVVINALRRRGYKLVTVPQLIADDPPQAVGAVRFTPGAG